MEATTIISDKSATKEFVPCRSRADVDNQLGMLHDTLANIMKFYNVNMTNTHYVNDIHDSGIEYIKDQKHDNVFVAHDVVPLSLARQVREFLTAIPFDNNKLVINDTDNQPQDKVFTFINCKGDAEHGLRIKAAYNNSKIQSGSPKEWVWERYHSDFWRAIPVTPEAFGGSPILTLISLLEKQWYNTNMTGIWGDKYILKGLRKATWVIQRIAKGKSMAWHTDTFGDRKVSFIYYLTPDDWTEDDGGYLFVKKNDNELNIEIKPYFNSLVFWDMWENKCPEHGVQTVKSDKPRLCLVGFFV